MRGREKAAQEEGEDAPSAPDGGLGRHATRPRTRELTTLPSRWGPQPLKQTGKGGHDLNNCGAHAGRDRLCQQLRRFRSQSSVQKLSDTLPRLSQPCFLEPLQ